LQRLAQYKVEVFLVPAASNFLSVPVNREWIANAFSLAADIQREGLTNVRGPDWRRRTAIEHAHGHLGIETNWLLPGRVSVCVI